MSRCPLLFTLYSCIPNGNGIDIFYVLLCARRTYTLLKKIPAFRTRNHPHRLPRNVLQSTCRLFLYVTECGATGEERVVDDVV